MDLEIVPHKSVGPIQFGMSREEVRALFPEVPHENTHPMAHIPSDEWSSLGIRVDYSPDAQCESVMLTGPTAPVAFKGRKLFESPHKELCAWLRELDPSATFPDKGEESLLCNNLGFMLGTPHSQEPEATRAAMAILAWKKGYWDDVEDVPS